MGSYVALKENIPKGWVSLVEYCKTRGLSYPKIYHKVQASGQYKRICNAIIVPENLNLNGQ